MKCSVPITVSQTQTSSNLFTRTFHTSRQYPPTLQAAGAALERAAKPHDLFLVLADARPHGACAAGSRLDNQDERRACAA